MSARPRTLARPAVLCVGGLDPSGGAGLLADAAAVWESGGLALCCATAITIQSCRGVGRFSLLSPRLVNDQVERLLDDEAPAAIKLGMLGSESILNVLVRLFERRLGRLPLVVDPIVRATSGTRLFTGRTDRGYATLFAMAAAVTPNRPEAELFLRKPLRDDRGATEDAAHALTAFFASPVVFKGGHQRRQGSDDLVIDHKGKITWLNGSRVPGDKRGTGCRFAAALACGLGRGDDLVSASRNAKALVRRYLIEH